MAAEAFYPSIKTGSEKIKLDMMEDSAEVFFFLADLRILTSKAH